MSERQRTITIAVALLLTFAAVFVRLRGPRPLPRQAPAGLFSAVRAFDALRATVGGTSPHPVATDANRAVRDRIAAHLRNLGYEVAIQRAFACTPNATCAPVENIFASLPGRTSGPVVLAVAHYDSVPAGPGASDDGVGVAVLLEAARALRTETTRNRIVFLIDDGEEAGLLGAEAFVADRNLSRDVAAVVNLEARGTRGPSFLFETSRNNRWLAPHVARSLDRPVTTSIFAAVYDRLPNDTDLTVFKRAGRQGVNFAFIGNVDAYHTPNDDLAHVDMRTLQHQGDNALGAIRALAGAPLPRTAEGNAVWFDVLGLFVIWWPESWSLAIAIAVALAAAAFALVGFRRGAMTAGGLGAGALLVAASIVIAPLAAALLTWIAHLRAPGLAWVARPQPLLAAAWIVGFGVPLAMASLLRRSFAPAALQRGVALAWSALAIAAAALVPGGSFLIAVPAAAALVPIAGAPLTAAVAGVLFFPFSLFLYDALGKPAVAIVALLVALVASTFAAATAPLRRRIGFAAAAVIVLLVAVAIVLPAVTPDQPRRLSLAWFDDGTGPVWTATALTPSLREAVSFDETRVTAPWLLRPPRLAAASAPRLAIPPPELTVIANEGDAASRRVRVRVRSRRAADRVVFAFHTTSALATLRVNGVAPPPPTGRFRRPFANNWHRVAVRASEAEIEIVTRGAAPLDVVIADYSYGLPQAGAALARVRDSAHAVPSDDGDMTITLRRLIL